MRIIANVGSVMNPGDHRGNHMSLLSEIHLFRS